MSTTGIPYTTSVPLHTCYYADLENACALHFASSTTFNKLTSQQNVNCTTTQHRVVILYRANIAYYSWLVLVDGEEEKGGVAVKGVEEAIGYLRNLSMRKSNQNSVIKAIKTRFNGKVIMLL
jgi:hypothetical protein